jgi:hypothetical protein
MNFVIDPAHRAGCVNPRAGFQVFGPLMPNSFESSRSRISFFRHTHKELQTNLEYNILERVPSLFGSAND